MFFYKKAYSEQTFYSDNFSFVRLLSLITLSLLSLAFATGDLFANVKSNTEIVSEESIIVALHTNESVTASGEEVEQETLEEKKEKEKTMNDINTFLIESYKLKIDKILSNLNLSLERITNNDPIAQARLLEKIRGDIDSKIHAMNSRNISENRKKILSSVFSYIQENLDAKISRLVQQK